MEEKIYLFDFTETYFKGINKHQKSGQIKLILKIISFFRRAKRTSDHRNRTSRTVKRVWRAFYLFSQN